MLAFFGSLVAVSKRSIARDPWIDQAAATRAGLVNPSWRPTADWR